MQNDDKSIKSSYLAFLDPNEKKWLSNFNKHFIKKYDENIDLWYFLEIDVFYSIFSKNVI